MFLTWLICSIDDNIIITHWLVQPQFTNWFRQHNYSIALSFKLVSFPIQWFILESIVLVLMDQNCQRLWNCTWHFQIPARGFKPINKVCCANFWHRLYVLNWLICGMEEKSSSVKVGWSKPSSLTNIGHTTKALHFHSSWLQFEPWREVRTTKGVHG